MRCSKRCRTDGTQITLHVVGTPGYATVRDWIATAKCLCATLLFFSCSFFTLSHPPSLSTPFLPFYSFPFPFHLLQMSALEQEDLVPDDAGEDNEWQDKDPPPSLVSGNVPSHSYGIFKGSSSS